MEEPTGVEDPHAEVEGSLSEPTLTVEGEVGSVEFGLTEEVSEVVAEGLGKSGSRGWLWIGVKSSSQIGVKSSSQIGVKSSQLLFGRRVGKVFSLSAAQKTALLL